MRNKKLLLGLVLGISITLSPLASSNVRNFVLFIGQVVLNGALGVPLITDANGQLASGLILTKVSATADTTTTSTTDVLMGSMTQTPGAGSYVIYFSTCVDHSAQSVAVPISLYANGAQITDSVRAPVPRFNALGANSLNPCVAIINIATIAAAQTLETRWKTASGTATAHQRTMITWRYAQ